MMHALVLEGKFVSAFDEASLIHGMVMRLTQKKF